MPLSVGIDIGNSAFKVAVWDVESEHPEVLANPDGSRSVPTMITLSTVHPEEAKDAPVAEDVAPVAAKKRVTKKKANKKTKKAPAKAKKVRADNIDLSNVKNAVRWAGPWHVDGVELVSGDAANRRYYANVKNTFVNVLDHLVNNAAHKEVTEKLPFKAENGVFKTTLTSKVEDADDVSVELTAKNAMAFLAHEVASIVKAQAKEGEDFSNHTVTLTYPDHFTAEQVAAVKDAFEAGKVHVDAAVPASHAAVFALHGDAAHAGHSDLVAVVDVGSSSASATLMKVSAAGTIAPMASKTTVDCSVSALRQGVATAAMVDFKKKCGITQDQLNARSAAKLDFACGEALRTISCGSTAKMVVEALAEGNDLFGDVKIVKFEMKARTAFRALDGLLEELAAEAGVSVEDVTHVYTVGGGAYIPKIRTVAGDAFPNATVVASGAADQDVAIGGAHHSRAIASAKVAGVTVPTQGVEVAVTSKAVSVVIAGVETVVLAAGSPAPASATVELPAFVADAEFSFKFGTEEVAAGKTTAAGSAATASVSVDGKITVSIGDLSATL